MKNVVADKKHTYFNAKNSLAAVQNLILSDHLAIKTISYKKKIFNFKNF